MTRAASAYKNRSRRMKKMSRRARNRARSRPSKNFAQKVKKVIRTNAETKTIGLFQRNTAPIAGTISNGRVSWPVWNGTGTQDILVNDMLPIIAPVVQGTGENQRIGDSLFVKFSQMRLKFKIGPYYNPDPVTIENINTPSYTTNAIWVHEIVATQGQLNGAFTVQGLGNLVYISLQNAVGTFLNNAWGTATVALNQLSFRSLCTYRPYVDAKSVGFWIRKTKKISAPIISSPSNGAPVTLAMSQFPKYAKFSIRNKTVKFQNDTLAYPYTMNHFVLVLNDSLWAMNVDFDNYMSFKDP